MMAVVKWTVVALCGLLGLGALGLAVMSGASLQTVGARPPVDVAPVALRAWPTARPVPAPAPSATPDAGTPPTPAPAPMKPDAGVRGAPATPPPGAPPPPAGEGILNLRASDTADVYVDGKKVGGSPVEGLKVKAGVHKVRFDCYDATGNTLPGAPRTVTVAADGEQTVEYPCPASE